MAKIDLKPLTMKELIALRSRIETAIERFEKKDKAAALAKLKKTAKGMGFSFDELVGSPRRSKKRAAPKKAAPKVVKYYDPDYPSNTWSGRGARPAWLREQIANGQTLDAFKVKD